MILGRGQTLNKLLHFLSRGVMGFDLGVFQKIILTTVWGLVGGQSKVVEKMNFLGR